MKNDWKPLSSYLDNKISNPKIPGLIDTSDYFDNNISNPILPGLGKKMNTSFNNSLSDYWNTLVDERVSELLKPKASYSTPVSTTIPKSSARSGRTHKGKPVRTVLKNG
jgi:hypothetical protein